MQVLLLQLQFPWSEDSHCLFAAFLLKPWEFSRIEKFMQRNRVTESYIQQVIQKFHNLGITLSAAKDGVLDFCIHIASSVVSPKKKGNTKVENKETKVDVKFPYVVFLDARNLLSSLSFIHVLGKSVLGVIREQNWFLSLPDDDMAAGKIFPP